MLGSIYHMTLNSFSKRIYGVKTLGFCHPVCKIAMSIIFNATKFIKKKLVVYQIS